LLERPEIKPNLSHPKPESGQFFVALVGSAIFGLGLDNFPKKSKNFQFLPFGSKSPGQRWVGLLFTAGQNYARVGSGLISS